MAQTKPLVIPAKAGIQGFQGAWLLDSRLRGNDGFYTCLKHVSNQGGVKKHGKRAQGSVLQRVALVVAALARIGRFPEGATHLINQDICRHRRRLAHYAPSR